MFIIFIVNICFIRCALSTVDLNTILFLESSVCENICFRECSSLKVVNNVCRRRLTFLTSLMIITVISLILLEVTQQKKEEKKKFSYLNQKSLLAFFFVQLDFASKYSVDFKNCYFLNATKNSLFLRSPVFMSLLILLLTLSAVCN